MRSSKSRSRSKQNRPRTLGNITNRVFESSGPEGKVRGTPQQIIEKYQLLARDAQLSNDRVAAENFMQHAEHYTRMLAEAQREMAAEQEARRLQQVQQGQGGGQNGGQQPQWRDRNGPQGGRDENDAPTGGFDVVEVAGDSSFGDARGPVAEAPISKDPPRDTSRDTPRPPRENRRVPYQQRPPREPRADAPVTEAPVTNATVTDAPQQEPAAPAPVVDASPDAAPKKKPSTRAPRKPRDTAPRPEKPEAAE